MRLRPRRHAVRRRRRGPGEFLWEKTGDGMDWVLGRFGRAVKTRW